MNDERELFKYSIIRYVPDAIRDEAVNIGVVLKSQEGDGCICRIHPDVQAELLRHGAGGNAEILAGSINKLVSDCKTEPLDEVGRRFCHMIRITRPRAMLVEDLKEDADRLYNIFVSCKPDIHARILTLLAGMGYILPEFDEPVAGTDEHNIRTYITALLALANNKPVDRMRIQMTFFMLSKDVDRIGRYLDYAPGGSGPYSKRLDEILDAMIKSGDLDAEESHRGGDKFMSNDEVVRSISDNYGVFEGMTEEEMMVFVDAGSPGMSEASGTYENVVKPNLEKHVMSLIRKAKITTSRGAKLLGIPYSEMHHKVKKAA